MTDTFTLVHEYWIVRHKTTNVVLPARVQSTKFDFKYRDKREPRLFRAAHTAQACVRAWAAGVWHCVMEQEGDWESGYYSYQGTPAPTPVAGRSADDLEGVRVTMMEPT